MLRFALREFDIMSRLHCGFPIVADICSARFARRSKLVIFDENRPQFHNEMSKYARRDEKKKALQAKLATDLRDLQEQLSQSTLLVTALRNTNVRLERDNDVLRAENEQHTITRRVACIGEEGVVRIDYDKRRSSSTSASARCRAKSFRIGRCRRERATTGERC